MIQSEIQRDYYHKNRKKIILKQLEWKKKNKDKIKQYEDKYRRKNLKKKAIKENTRRKRVIGLISMESCAICDAPKTECHHPDYALPLYVVHLCKHCHRKIHSNEISEKKIKEVYMYEI